MTAKQAVEALMQRTPHSATLKYLRKEGLLNDILYPEGRMRRSNNLVMRGSAEGENLNLNLNTNHRIERDENAMSSDSDPLLDFLTEETSKSESNWKR